MAKAINTCPIRLCDETIPRGRLMCIEHWYMVPRKIRRAVNAAWRAVNAAWRAVQADNSVPAVQAYRTARDDAFDAAHRELGL